MFQICALTLVLCVMIISADEEFCKQEHSFQGLNAAECCDLPEIFDQPSLDECEGEYGQISMEIEEDPKNRNLALCTFECIFNKTGVYNSNGETFNDDNFKAVLTETEKEIAEWNSILTGSYDKCRKFIDEHGDDINKSIQESNSSEMTCGIKPTIMSFCLFGVLLAECPEPLFHPDVKDCTKFKKFLNECIMN